MKSGVVSMNYVFTSMFAGDWGQRMLVQVWQLIIVALGSGRGHNLTSRGSHHLASRGRHHIVVVADDDGIHVDAVEPVLSLVGSSQLLLTKLDWPAGNGGFSLRQFYQTCLGMERSIREDELL